MLKLGRRIFLQNDSTVRLLGSNQLQIGLTNRNNSSSYEGDGKTKINVLNNNPEMGLMVNSFSEVSEKNHLNSLQTCSP